jgi:hypothetical protein
VPQFVILAHDWPEPHFDLLLEAGPVLKAWRLLAEPAMNVAVPAEPNADHRAVYLDYEGPVSGGRGDVIRWDNGTYEGRVGGATWQVEWSGGRLRGVAGMSESEGRFSFRVNDSLTAGVPPSGSPGRQS